MGLGIVEPKGLSNTTDVLGTQIPPAALQARADLALLSTGTSLLEVVNATQSATQGLKTAKNNPDIGTPLVLPGLLRSPAMEMR